MALKEEKTAAKKSGRRIGVGRTPRVLAGSDLLDEGAQELANMEEDGEFVPKIPVEKVKADPRNKRGPVHFFTDIKDDIANVVHEGKYLLDYLKDPEFDLEELDPKSFFDIKAACDYSDDDPDVVANAWFKILRLARSIYFKDVTSPIEVRRDQTYRDQYTINYGHRRYLGNYLAGRTTIRSIVTNTDALVDDLYVTEKRWSENHDNEPLTFWEECLEYKSYRTDYFEKFGKYPTNVYVSSQMSLHRKAVDRMAAVIKAEDHGLLTNRFRKAIKTGQIHQKNIVALVNRAIKNDADESLMDAFLEEAIASQKASQQAPLTNENSDNNNGLSNKESESNKSGSESSKRNRNPAATLKVKDITFGRRVIKALKQEFVELGDVNENEIDDVSQIDALLRRLI